MSGEWLSIEALAAELDVSPWTVRRWRQAGKAPRAHKIGRHVRFRRDDVNTWLAASADPEPVR